GRRDLRFPITGWVERRLTDPGAHLGVAQVVEKLPAGRGPGRQDRRETGAAGGIGIHIGGDVDPLGTRRVDPRDHGRHLVPVFAAGRLEMVDLDRRAGDLADLDRLVHTLQELVTFGAQVGDVDTTGARYLFADFRDLLGCGKGIGWVD